MNNIKKTINLKASSKFKRSEQVVFKNKLDDPHYQKYGSNAIYFVEGIRFIQEITTSNVEGAEITQAVEYLLLIERDIDILDGTPLNRNSLLSVAEDLLTNAELTLEELKELGDKFDAIVVQKHYWVWRKDVINLIDYMKKHLPNPTNQEIYDRVGETFVDWDAQAIKDDKDWHEALDKIAGDRNLLPHEKQQLQDYLSCDF